MKAWIVCCTILALLNGGAAFGQQTSGAAPESHKNRTIFTIAGAGGGFALGVFAGLAAFDDAVNSDRKVWETATLSAVGGAVAGYFIGRALDKRARKGAVTSTDTDFNVSLPSVQRPALRYDPYAGGSVANPISKTFTSKAQGKVPLVVFEPN